MTEKLREVVKKMTPGPWQTRFLYRTFQAGREAPDLEVGTKPEQDWPDCEGIVTLRNCADELVAVEAQARKVSEFLDGRWCEDHAYRERFLLPLKEALAALDAKLRG